MPGNPEPPEDRNRRLLPGGEEIPLGGVIGKGDPYSKGIRPICPECGELWGRINFGGTRHGKGEYLVARWPCELHGDVYFTGGSIWKLLVWWDRGIPPSLGAALPLCSAQLLRRECLLRAYQILGEIPRVDELEREPDAHCGG